MFKHAINKSNSNTYIKPQSNKELPLTNNKHLDALCKNYGKNLIKITAPESFRTKGCLSMYLKKEMADAQRKLTGGSKL